MPSKSQRILVDIDGVMADFCEAFTRTARGLDPEQPIISTVSQPTWNLRGIMSPKLVNATWDQVRRTDKWWLDMYPLFTEQELNKLQSIMTRHEVVFCTGRKAQTRRPGDPSIAAQTSEWLERKGIKRPSVLCCSRKGDIARALGATFAIDDKPENVYMTHYITDKECQSWVLDRPYNRDYPFPDGVRRGSLGDFLDAIAGPSGIDKTLGHAQVLSAGEGTQQKAA